MSGLNHEFYLLSEKDYLIGNLNFDTLPEGVSIHDSILQYIADTLNWIDCGSPTPKGVKSLQGLNWYGDTIISKDGAEKTRNIFNLWAEIFMQSSEILELTGSYFYDFNEGLDEDGLPKKRGYNKLLFKRDEIVENLRTIANYADEVLHSDDLYILHLGI